ncbi:MAG: HEAT repeat domain-containing protein [Spirochaetales bacterium]
MKMYKIAICMVALLLTVGAVVAQEVTVEESSVESVYLQTNEDLIISEMAASPSYETKLITLQYIQEALNEGRTSTTIEATLHSLGGEGVLTESRTAGHLDNNYSEIRRQACLMLATIPTEETKDFLLDLMRSEKEPMVLSAAIYALGEIGLNDGDDVINEITAIHSRFSVLNPTDSLANATLDALEKLLPVSQNSAGVVETLASIATNYKYITPVRQKALNILGIVKGSD